MTRQKNPGSFYFLKFFCLIKDVGDGRSVNTAIEQNNRKIVKIQDASA